MNIRHKFLIVIGMVAVFIGIMEIHPAVEQARMIIPASVYAGGGCDCFCILESRPWYARFNYWFWLLVFFVPAIISSSFCFSMWPRAGIFVVLIGYVLLNLSVELGWDIRNAPFIVNNNPNSLDQATWDMDCANIADGANRVFTRYFGWAPVLLFSFLSLAVTAFIIRLFQMIQRVWSSRNQ